MPSREKLVVMDNQLLIEHVAGPFREPKEPVLSYDYSVKRASWPLCHMVRIKVSIPAELDWVKQKLSLSVSGTAGQQLLLNQILSRRIADQKLRIMDAEGMLSERRDVVIDAFTGPLEHLLPQLDTWVTAEQESLRADVKERARL